MSDERTATEAIEKIKKPARRKKRRAAPRVKAAAKPVPAGDHPELEGLTQAECPFDCSPEKCVITGINVCGHPHKGGLQSALLNKPDVVRTYNAARRIIARQISDKKI